MGTDLIAGFVNAHTHLYSGLAPLGMPAPESPPRGFVEILEKVWWRLDRAIDQPSLAAAARFYLVEALAAGTAALIDHHESPNFIEGSLEVLADACQDLGIRALLCYGATGRNGGRGEARRGLAECRRFLLANRRPLVRGTVGLHASFTVSDETIREAGGLCRELGAVLHVHVAEDVSDVDDARRRGYAGPLERLHALGALVPGSILAHGVHLTTEQVKAAEDLGCWLVQNPRSNRRNGVGYPVALRASRRVALGTDGFPSDMRVELGVLVEDADRRGEADGEPAARLDRGWEIIAERFGDVRVESRDAGPDARSVTSPADAGTVRDTARAHAPSAAPRRTVVPPSGPRLEEIRVEARGEAERLWSRMRAL